MRFFGLSQETVSRISSRIFCAKTMLSGKLGVSAPLKGVVDHFYELTSSHTKTVLSSELASLAHEPDVLIPDKKHLGKKAQKEVKPCQVASDRSVHELGCQGCSNNHWNITDSLASKAVADLKTF